MRSSKRVFHTNLVELWGFEGQFQRFVGEMKICTAQLFMVHVC